eukprot:UN34848
MDKFVEQLFQIFSAHVDQDGNGEVTRDEFEDLTKTLDLMTQNAVQSLGSTELADFVENNAKQIDAIWSQFDMNGDGVLDEEELELFFIRLTQEVVVAQTGKMPSPDQCIKYADEIRNQFLGDSKIDEEGLSREEFKELGNLIMLTAITAENETHEGDEAIHEAENMLANLTR